MSGTRQHLTDAAYQSIILPVCVWNQTQLFSSLSKLVPRPPCLEPDNISLMRPVKAEFFLFVSGNTPVCSAGHCKKAWFPIAASHVANRFASYVQIPTSARYRCKCWGIRLWLLSMDGKSVDCQ